MSYLRGIFKAIAFVIITLYFLVKTSIRVAFKGNKNLYANGQNRQWIRTVGKLLNVKISQEGHLPDEGALFIANHRSYLDAIILMRDHLCTVVMKAEVWKWPLIGWGARLTNSIPVQRDSKESRRKTRESVRFALENQLNVMLFPEGTTTRFPEMKEFRPGIFKVAAEGDFPIVPAAIEYEDPNIAWIGADTFPPHFFYLCRQKEIRVHVRIGPVLRGNDAEELRAEVEGWVKERLQNLQSKVLGSY